MAWRPRAREGARGVEGLHGAPDRRERPGHAAGCRRRAHPGHAPGGREGGGAALGARRARCDREPSRRSERGAAPRGLVHGRARRPLAPDPEPGSRESNPGARPGAAGDRAGPAVPHHSQDDPGAPQADRQAPRLPGRLLHAALPRAAEGAGGGPRAGSTSRGPRSWRSSRSGGTSTGPTTADPPCSGSSATRIRRMSPARSGSSTCCAPRRRRRVSRRSSPRVPGRTRTWIGDRSSI
jgi:hypothetical protein